jgi:hypothetical protein
VFVKDRMLIRVTASVRERLAATYRDVFLEILKSVTRADALRPAPEGAGAAQPLHEELGPAPRPAPTPRPGP